VFVLGAVAGRGRVDHTKALDARRWTEVVQAVLKRHRRAGPSRARSRPTTVRQGDGGL